MRSQRAARSGRFEVLIAGAGPAGVACAVALLRRDSTLRGRLLVCDRAQFPRNKPCGGGLTGHADEAMEALGLELTVPAVASERAVVRCGSEERTIALARPVRVVRREDFDASLVEQARALGAEVWESAPLDGFTVGEAGVEAGVGGQRIEARVLVGADGAGSLVRKRLSAWRGARRPRGSASTPLRLFRSELQGRSPYGEAMLYDFTPMAEGLRGYLWIFPVPGGRLNVGLMHYPALPLSGAELAELLARHLRPHGITLDGSPRGWPAWAYAPSMPIAAERLLSVGDAAGIDALTGEGIAVGLEQGAIAAAEILDALTRGDFRFREYARRVRQATVGRELALDRLLARMLYAEDGWRRWLSLVMYDDRMLELYAARVSGSLILADHKQALAAALARQILHGRSRERALEAALGGGI